LYLQVAEEVVAREPALRHVPSSTDVERRYRSRIADLGRSGFVAVMDGSVIGSADAGLSSACQRSPTR